MYRSSDGCYGMSNPPLRLYFEPSRPMDEGPNAFSAAVAARAWEALRSKHKRVPQMQSPWEPKAVERQVGSDWEE